MIISDEKLEEMRKEGTEFLDRLKDRVHEQQWEIERLNNIIDKAIELIDNDDIYDYKLIVDKLLRILQRRNKNE